MERHADTITNKLITRIIHKIANRQTQKTFNRNQFGTAIENHKTLKSRKTCRPVTRLGQSPGKRKNAVSNIGARPNRWGGNQNLCNMSEKGKITQIVVENARKEQKICERERLLTFEVSLFGRALDVVRSFDYGHIQILILGNRF